MDPTTANRITSIDLGIAVFAFSEEVYLIYRAGEGTIASNTKAGKWFYLKDGVTPTWAELDESIDLPADASFISQTNNIPSSGVTNVRVHLAASTLDRLMSVTDGWCQVTDDQENTYYMPSSSMPQRVRVWQKIGYEIEDVAGEYLMPAQECVLNAMLPFTFGTEIYGESDEMVSSEYAAIENQIISASTSICMWGADLPDARDWLHMAGGASGTLQRNARYGFMYLDANGNTIGQPFYFSRNLGTSEAYTIIPGTSGKIRVPFDNPQHYLFPSVWLQLTYSATYQTAVVNIPAGATAANFFVELSEFGRYPDMMMLRIVDTTPISVSVTTYGGVVPKQGILMMKGANEFKHESIISVAAGGVLEDIEYAIEVPATSAGNMRYFEDGAWKQGATTNVSAEDIATGSEPADIDATLNDVTRTLTKLVDINKARAIMDAAAVGKPAIIPLDITITGNDAVPAPHTVINKARCWLYLDMDSTAITFEVLESEVAGSTLLALTGNLIIPVETGMGFKLDDFLPQNRSNLGEIQMSTHNGKLIMSDVVLEDVAKLKYGLQQQVQMQSGENTIKGRVRSDFNCDTILNLTLATLSTNELNYLDASAKSRANIDNTTSTIVTIRDHAEPEPAP